MELCDLAAMLELIKYMFSPKEAAVWVICCNSVEAEEYVCSKKKWMLDILLC